MAKLTAKLRRAQPVTDFAGPNRSFPIENRTHAIDAKARTTQAVKAGRITPGEAAKIGKDADAVINRS